MSMTLSHPVTSHPSPSPYHQVHSLVGLCLYARLPTRFFMTFFFFLRFHIYVLAYCICFSLSDLLHSVWQTLTPSTSLRITQFRFFFFNVLCASFWICSIDPSFFFKDFLKNVGHFRSLHWVCYNIAPVPCFGLLAPTHVGSWLPYQGMNPHPLHWKAKSQPLDCQGSPWPIFLNSLTLSFAEYNML